MQPTLPATPLNTSIMEFYNELEFHYKPKILLACNHINQYLHENKQLEDVKGSVAGLVQTTFHKLKSEIEQSFLRDHNRLFPEIKKAYEGQTNELNALIESAKATHALISTVVKNLRQVMCGSVVNASWSSDFRDCIDHLYSLENNIYKWIAIEENIVLHNASCFPDEEIYSIYSLKTA